MMKRLIFALTAALMLCAGLQGQNRIVTEKDEEGNKKRVIELRDTLIDGKEVTDTLSVMSYESSEADSEADSGNYDRHHNAGMEWNGFSIGDKLADTLISIVAVVFIFGLPVLIVLIVVLFRYKNRKAKYRLAEQILASGQPLPENFFKSVVTATEDIRSKGIKNIFLGAGLFIFLWAITDTFGIGCIGLLIMLTGFGQLMIHYTQQGKNGSPFINISNDETTGESRLKVGGIEINNREKKAENQDEEQ